MTAFVNRIIHKYLAAGVDWVPADEALRDDGLSDWEIQLYRQALPTIIQQRKERLGNL